MMRNFARFFSLLMLVFISGCIPYYKLSKKEFPQGTNLETHYGISKNYIKSQSVYEQFTTLAQFDAIWLSDQTRIAYVDMHCQRRGKNENAKEAILNRQLEENRHWISFYVLADVRDVMNCALTDKNPYWTMYLEIGDEKLEPVEIKEVDLEPEYVDLFGNKLNSFKTVYHVSFSAQDMGGKFYLDGCKTVKLSFNSVIKSCTMEWDLEKISKDSIGQENMSKDLDFYWGN